jgi:ribosome-binding factor A
MRENELQGDISIDKYNEVMEGLNSAKGIVRKEIGEKVRTFNTPEVKFIYDDSMAYGQHIEEVLESLNIKHDEEETEENSEQSNDNNENEE